MVAAASDLVDQLFFHDQADILFVPSNPTFAFLTYETEDFKEKREKFWKACSRAVSVRSVELGKSFSQCLDAETLSLLLQSLGAMPHLERLRVQGCRQAPETDFYRLFAAGAQRALKELVLLDCAILPVEDTPLKLAKALEACQFLEHVNISLQHDVVDSPFWLTIIKTLSRCPSLLSLRLKWLDDADIDDEFLLDELALTLGSLFESPSLQKLAFHFPVPLSRKERFSLLIFPPLATSQNLTELKLEPYSMTTGSVLNFLFEALADNKTVRRLDLTGVVTPYLDQDLGTLSRILVEKNTVLEEVLLPRLHGTAVPESSLKPLRLMTRLNSASYRERLPTQLGLWAPLLAVATTYPACVYSMICGSRGLIPRSY